ncbi:hypothetical protein [Jejuia pallidilutea]|nr:hypothetical protein [Jejuia pallidilutea]
MSDILTDSRKLRVLNIMDDCNRETLSITAGLSYPARTLIETLENLKKEDFWCYLEVGIKKTLYNK